MPTVLVQVLGKIGARKNFMIPLLKVGGDKGYDIPLLIVGDLSPVPHLLRPVSGPSEGP